MAKFWLLLLSALRAYARHPWQTLLALAGISLGIAVYVGISIANAQALTEFDRSASILRGNTTHRVLPIGESIPEQVFVDLTVRLGLTAAAVIEQRVTIDGLAGDFLLMGTDPVTSPVWVPQISRPDGKAGAINVSPLILLTRFMTETNTVIASESVRRQLALITGAESSDTSQHLVLSVMDEESSLPVVLEILPGADSPEPSVLLVDLSTAQEVLRRPGSLSRIDLRLTEEQVAALEESLPAGMALIAAGDESRRFDQLSQAFEINILALGLLALIVGMFMVYSTMSFMVVRRQRDLARLRAIGVSRGELALAVLTEAVLIAAVGVLAGLLIGTWLVNLLFELVSSATLGFGASNGNPSPGYEIQLYLEAAAVGFGASLLAALVPIMRASRIAPGIGLRRSEIERSSARNVRRAAKLALPVALTAACMLALVPGKWLSFSFAALALFLIACAMLVPFLLTAVAKLLAPLLYRLADPSALLAARNIVRQGSQVAVATAALTLAVAAVIGIGIMTWSFRLSLERWLDVTLTADVYVSLAAGQEPAESRPTTDDILGALRSDPRVSAISETAQARIPSEYGAILVRGFLPGARGWGLEFVSQASSEENSFVPNAVAVSISEPFAYRNNLGPGTRLRLAGTTETAELDIRAIHREYNTAGADIIMALDTFVMFWPGTPLTSLGIEMAASADRLGVIADLETILPAERSRMLDTGSIKALSLQIFDRTFVITDVLSMLAAIIAFLGMLSAIMTVQLQREQEFALLRSLGFRPAQIARLIITETTFTGMLAGILSVPVGISLAALLVYVINVRSFGWSMSFAVSPGAILLGLFISAGAAAIAGIFSAAKQRRPDFSAALQLDQ